MVGIINWVLLIDTQLSESESNHSTIIVIDNNKLSL